jgi:transcriptional regulator with XRE-family HTH domain
MNSSNHLRQYRRAQRLSQTDLGTIAGLRQESISRIEQGVSKPHRATRRVLANALGVPVDLIFPKSPDSAVSEALRFLREHAPEQLAA